MVKIVNVVGDLHNFDSLSKILNQFDNVISSGDIGATIEKNEFFSNVGRYNKSFKAFAKKEFSTISEEDINWFRKINVDGWIKQLDTIKDSNKKFTLNMGNADLAMISFFTECLDYLEKIIKESKLEFIREPSLKTFGNIQIIFLPFINSTYELGELLRKIDLNKPLFVIAHCPAFKLSKKQYYMYYYKAIEDISIKYKKKLYYIHGHIHPNKSYKYTREGLDNVIFLVPKAEESFEGINVNHHVIQINTKDGSFRLLDSVSGKYTKFVALPEEFYTNEDHWNHFNNGVDKFSKEAIQDENKK